MAKGKKGRTFRKKMGGNPENLKEEEKIKYSSSPVDISKLPEYSSSPVDISKLPEYYREKIQLKTVLSTKPTEKNIFGDILYAGDRRGGKLRRTRKRRMTKRRKNSRKSRKSKSRKMRGGVFMGNYLSSFLKPGQQKKQEIFDVRKELNPYFENQPVKEEINRIEERNNNPEYDNIRTFSPDYIKKMEENMKNYNKLKQ